MSYINLHTGLGAFGKSMMAPPPEPPPPDTAPVITPEEEQKILEATMPLPEPEPSFVRRNYLPLVVGGGAIFLGVIGLFLFSR